jgi:hypothetical protein
MDIPEGAELLAQKKLLTVVIAENGDQFRCVKIFQPR